jgi:hypothetical protein
MRPSFSINSPSLETEGAGNAGCGLHPWSACNKKARGRTTGSAGAAGIPRAMVLRLIRDLPGDQALLPPLPCVISQGVAPALGRQDHTISPSASRHSSRHAPRPSHPASNVRDDREAPLLWQRDARMIVVICPTTQEEMCTTGSLRMAGMRCSLRSSFRGTPTGQREALPDDRLRVSPESRYSGFSPDGLPWNDGGERQHSGLRRRVAPRNDVDGAPHTPQTLFPSDKQKISIEPRVFFPEPRSRADSTMGGGTT